jgi:tRNA modification GTPase
MDTIFALSSGRGKAGISVIRISGTEAPEALKALGVNELPEPRVAKVIKLKDGNGIIDHALVMYFKAPHSFSGEDIIEIHAHGSIAVVENILGILSKMNNLRLAEPGEFSKRAFENGKMDLVQAEGLADLIDAETSAQAKQAMRAMEGEASKVYESWRERIIEIIAFMEAYIDFPDENIPHDLDMQAQEKVKKIIAEIGKQVANDNGERLRTGAVATIIGSPNVGKSTLINFLSRRDVAIVSDIAGTTRDALEVHLNIEGLPVTVIDTAGIRKSADTIEQEGVRRALEKAEKADIRIIIFDNDDMENMGEDIRKYLNDENSILVRNKMDLNPEPKAKKLINEIINLVQDGRIVKISLKDGTGTDEFLKRLKKIADKLLGNSENAIITRRRHKTSLESCMAELEEFISARKRGLPVELCGENLRRASFYLGKITGKIGIEDILDKIFSEFCIGK